MEIQRLSEEVVNQIAAGEVVERPAQIVKELLENSIDAGASAIEVSISIGGREIAIQDNGRGIEPNELRLAVERHATSKINSYDDLWRLNSYGFRGEALASIGAVSNLEVISQTKSGLPHKVQVQFGKISETEPAAGTTGTFIKVSNLFENVPARLKFMKSDGAEVAQIKNVLRAVAISHPAVSFRIRVNEKPIYYWPAQNFAKDRVQSVLEQEKMFEVEQAWGEFNVKAVLSGPHVTVGNSKQIWIFVQNRWVQDRGIQAAILESYRSLLMHGEFPVVALWLNCDSQHVDVNIHPTKSQVKFRDPSSVFRAVHHTLRDYLERAPWLTNTQGVRPVFSNSNNVTPSQPTPVNYTMASPEFDKISFQQKDFLNASAESYTFPTIADLKMASDLTPKEVTVQGNSGYWQQLQVLGQANLTYILAQSAQALVLVDQHAAHERIMYERIMERWLKNDIEIQDFLLPLTFEMSEDHVSALEKVIKDLEKLGLSLEPSGPTQISVRAAPSIVTLASLAPTLEKLASELCEHGGSFAFENHLRELASTLACHSAIRAGQSLSLPEMEDLIRQMDEFSLSSFCPHGRPVHIEYPYQKMERDFGRIN